MESIELGDVDAAVLVEHFQRANSAASELEGYSFDEIPEQGPLRRPFLQLVRRYMPDEERMIFPLKTKLDLELVRQCWRAGLVGVGPNMVTEIMPALQRAGMSKSPVLIRGETGTGKDIAARSIHATSKRRDKKFVTVNCGGLSGTMLQSDLFGHKAGAFTDASTDKFGRVEEANGGTLFLDEIGDIPTEVQVHLLRFLNGDGEYYRLGDPEPRNADVRIVSATNQDVEAKIKEGAVRDDFYYRIAGRELRLRPLFLRLADLPLLIYYFIKEFNKAHDGHVTSVCNWALRQAVTYRWPGNVRELRAKVWTACEETLERSERPGSLLHLDVHAVMPDMGLIHSDDLDGGELASDRFVFQETGLDDLPGMDLIDFMSEFTKGHRGRFRSYWRMSHRLAILAAEGVNVDPFDEILRMDPFDQLCDYKFKVVKTRYFRRLWVLKEKDTKRAAEAAGVSADIVKSSATKRNAKDFDQVDNRGVFDLIARYSFARIRSEYSGRMIAKHHGNVSAAAEAARMDRSTITKYGVDC